MSTSPQCVSENLEEKLVDRYGEVVTDDVLYNFLGFNSASSFRRALHQHRIPVPVFEFGHRRGRYCLTRDIAQLLQTARESAIESNGER